MILLKYLLRTARARMVITTLLSGLSAACNTGLIMIVTAALREKGMNPKTLLGAFIAFGLGKIATNFASQVMLVTFAQGAVADLRRDLIRKILGVPLRNLEEIGSARILVALTDDVFSITQALLGIPFVATNLAMLLGGAVYMGWLSWQILLAVGGLILFGAFGYRPIVSSAFRFLHLAREEADKLFGYFRPLNQGI